MSDRWSQNGYVNERDQSSAAKAKAFSLRAWQIWPPVLYYWLCYMAAWRLENLLAMTSVLVSRTGKPGRVRIILRNWLAWSKCLIWLIADYLIISAVEYGTLVERNAFGSCPMKASQFLSLIHI